MFFAYDITITANTAAADPKTQTLKLTKGIMTKLEIYFPPGCHGMVKVRILRSESQLIPLSKDEWVTGDGEAVPTEGFYELETTPADLKFVGCSPGTDFNHTVTVRVQILPRAVATFMPLVNAFKSFLRHIGALV